MTINNEKIEKQQDVDKEDANWGYDLVCEKLAERGGAAADDMAALFDYVSGHETCFLEFKATPYKPDKEKSCSNPYGFERGETDDDYSWNVVKSIIGLANSAGGAVVLGVKDKGHVPILEIANSHWTGDQWDGFSRNLFGQIFHRSYTLAKAKKSISLDDASLVTLENLCTITCRSHKGCDLPVILVKPTFGQNFIYIKERNTDTDILLVRKAGDAGETKPLKGREIRVYERPDKASYISEHDAHVSQVERPFHNLVRFPGIVGRSDELDRLNRCFSSDARVQWIYGGPGIGKTAFVQSYIERMCGPNSENFDFVFFLSAQDRTFVQSLCQLNVYARCFEDFCGIKLIDEQNDPLDRMLSEDIDPRRFRILANDIVKKLNTYHGPGNILIVLDDVDDSYFAQEDLLVLDTAINGRIRFCMTSRVQPVKNDLVSPFELSHLTVGDALDILDRCKAITNERESAQEIVRLVDCNAWALNLIATQISNDQEPSPYSRKLNELKGLGLTLALKDKNSGEDLSRLYAPSISRLRSETDRGGSPLLLLTLTAWFHQEAISEDMLKKAFKRHLFHTVELLPSINSEREWECALEQLRKEGFVQWSPEKNSYRTPSFVREVLWTLPETYCTWQSVFEIFREEFYNACQEKNSSVIQQSAQMLRFFELTVTDHAVDEVSKGRAYGNAVEIMKWIASEQNLRILLRRTIEKFGNLQRIRSLHTALFEIARREYEHNHNSKDAVWHYRYYLSNQKTAAVIWEQNIKRFKELGQMLRIVFEKHNNGTEEEELTFAQELISDVMQYDKLSNYAAVKQDLKKALELILKYKDKQLGLLVKSYLEISNIELEFKKYGRVRKILNEILKISRKANTNLPREELLLFCKEQKAYMHLCQVMESTGVTKWWHARRARIRYKELIKVLSLRDGEESEKRSVPKDLLLFKAHYFLAVTYLNADKIESAEKQLKKALEMCDYVFVETRERENEVLPRIQFNVRRVKSGILRLNGENKEAQEEDREALRYYQDSVTSFPNLDVADLLDDYGNTYAFQGNFEKAIKHVKEALEIRELLLPPTHVKIRNSYSRLAYLLGITAMQRGQEAHMEIRKMQGGISNGDDRDRLSSSPWPILKRLEAITRFGNESQETFLKQLRDDEQREECERVRTWISDLQDNIFDARYIKK